MAELAWNWGTVAIFSVAGVIGLALVLGFAAWMFNVAITLGKIHQAVAGLTTNLEGHQEWIKSLDMKVTSLQERISKVEFHQRDNA